MMKRLFLESIEKWSGNGVLSLMGPTGSGKSSTLVSHLRKNPQIKHPLLVSVDAVAVYRGLDIGSAKAIGQDRSDFAWAGLDFKNADETCSVRDFLDEVENDIAQALTDERAVVFVGGSGFYENALVEGLAPGGASDPDFQKQLETVTNEALYKRLNYFDKRWGEFLHVNDRYRLTRYLDLVERQGFNWQDLRESKKRNPKLQKLWRETTCVILGLEWPRETYLERLETRIHEMWDLGWAEETRALLEKYPAESVGLQTIGYKEMVEHLQDSQSTIEKTKQRILMAHIQYVKRQKTWLRSLKGA